MSPFPGSWPLPVGLPQTAFALLTKPSISPSRMQVVQSQGHSGLSQCRDGIWHTAGTRQKVSTVPQSPLPALSSTSLLPCPLTKLLITCLPHSVHSESTYPVISKHFYINTSQLTNTIKSLQLAHAGHFKSPLPVSRFARSSQEPVSPHCYSHESSSSSCRRHPSLTDRPPSWFCVMHFTPRALFWDGHFCHSSEFKYQSHNEF